MRRPANCMGAHTTRRGAGFGGKMSPGTTADRGPHTEGPMSWNDRKVIDLDTHIRGRVDLRHVYIMSPDHIAHLERLPPEAVAEGRRFHAIGSRNRSIGFCVAEPGEDLRCSATGWPRGDTARPESVQQITGGAGGSASATRKMLGENALRLCPGLRA